MYFSETVEAFGVKVGRYNKLNEYINIYMNLKSRSFFELSKFTQISLIQTGPALKQLGLLELNCFFFWLIPITETSP